MLSPRLLTGLCLGLTIALGACGQDASRHVTPPVDGPEEPIPPQDLDVGSATLKAVRARGVLNCGVNMGLVGFAFPDNKGGWQGFDVDFCRATAAAIFGTPTAVRFVPLSAEGRFEALKTGKVDVLWRNSSWTMTRDARGDVGFAGINYYDGQGFLVRRSLNLSSAAELNGARICVQRGSTTELNLEDYFRARSIQYRPVLVQTEEESRQAYAREECDAMTADISALAATRTTMTTPAQHVILPDVISKEPLGPVVRRGDDQWEAIIRWTLNALILGEELGVTQSNVERLARESNEPRIGRLLGDEGEFGPSLGLSRTWAKDAIAAGGNYGEIFVRNLGKQSALDLERGLNAQWNAQPSGLIYALPIR